MERLIAADDTWVDALIELIPAEIVAAYLGLQGYLIDLGHAGITGLAMAILTIFTALYLYKLNALTKSPQLIFSAVAFLIWVHAKNPTRQTFEPPDNNPGWGRN
jgi:hypothetical protein